MEQLKKDIQKQQELFEEWYKLEYGSKLPAGGKKTDDGLTYIEFTTQHLFRAFCAGAGLSWDFK